MTGLRFAAGAGLALWLAFAAPSGAAAGEGEAAVGEWLAALSSGERARIEAVLAPEFQIQRADGSAHDREEYLASGLPSLPSVPRFSDAVATVNGDVMVVRYTLDLPDGATVGGETVAAVAPRLTVFHRLQGEWRVAAHANFAPHAR